jgi:hypothetical protein
VRAHFRKKLFMKNLCLCLLKNSGKKKDLGFTLIELITASAMSLFIVASTGFALIVMLREQTSTNISGDTQFNLNRAADFIKDEIQQASYIETGVSLPSGCGSGTSILSLTIPFASTFYNVHYSVKTPSSIWLGDNAIFRCAPPLGADGNLSGRTPGSLTSEVLVDLIASTRDSKDSGICANGGTAYPSNNTGFFVCVVNNNRVELHLAASALDNQDNNLQWISSDAASRLGSKAQYGVITQAYARSRKIIPISSGGVFGEAAEATFSTSGTCTFPLSVSVSGTSAGSITSTGSKTFVLASAGTLSVGSLSSTSVNSNTIAFSGSGCTVNASLVSP